MKTTKRVRPRGSKPVRPSSTSKFRVPPKAARGGSRGDRVPRKNGLVILLLEDDQDHRDALTYLLEEAGYEVASATDGLQGMERMRWGLRPNAILLDMRMHVMNGWEFRRELARDPACSGTPVVIMSGAPFRPADLVGCADWISKPVDGPELLRKLERCTRLVTSFR
jgi:CheY-like chemotaxis protein